MIQYKKDTATQPILTDIVSVARKAFETVRELHRNSSITFSDQYTDMPVWLYIDKDRFPEMLITLFQYIISLNERLSEMIFAVAANESKVQISICDDGHKSTSEISEIIANSIAAGTWTGTEPGMREALELICRYNGQARFVKSGKPYNQLLIEFPILNATKD